MALWAAYFLCPYVALLAVQLFSCYPVNVAGGNGINYYTPSMSRDCASTEIIASIWLIGVPFFVLFSSGHSYLCFRAMFQHKTDIQEFLEIEDAVKQPPDSTVRMRYGMLFVGYRKELWWWEIVDFIRRSCLLFVVAVFKSAGQEMQSLSAFLVVISFLIYGSNIHPSHSHLAQQSAQASRLCFCGCLIVTVYQAGATRTHVGWVNVSFLIFQVSPLLFFIYAGYLMLWKHVEDPKNPELCDPYGVAASRLRGSRTGDIPQADRAWGISQDGALNVDVHGKFDKMRKKKLSLLELQTVDEGKRRENRAVMTWMREQQEKKMLQHTDGNGEMALEPTVSDPDVAVLDDMGHVSTRSAKNAEFFVAKSGKVEVVMNC